MDLCRICMDDTPPLIELPCSCVGYVHMNCLDKWRNMHKEDDSEIPFYKCEICKNLYTFIRCYFTNKQLKRYYFTASTLLHLLGFFLSPSPLYVIFVGSGFYFSIYFLEGLIYIFKYKKCSSAFITLNLELIYVLIITLIFKNQQILLPICTGLLYGKHSYSIVYSIKTIVDTLVTKSIDLKDWLYQIV